MSSKSRVDAVLAQFPGPLTLQVSRLKMSLRLLGSLTVVAVGIWLTWTKGYNWEGLIFFGLWAIVYAVMLLPGAGGLRLDRDGFETTILFRHHRSRWQDVSEFDVWSPAGGIARMVGMDDTRSVEVLEMVVYNNKNLARRVRAKLGLAIASCEAGLPNTDGLAASDLAILMTRWRERALSQASS
jgi:hypothetical protein